ncbi:MAG: hypothetical protein SGJ07_03095 [Rhodospirillaceae bacterium]|nr:hypothetical protein [Rhodospirillaceae bacterium]
MRQQPVIGIGHRGLEQPAAIGIVLAGAAQALEEILGGTRPHDPVIRDVRGRIHHTVEDQAFDRVGICCGIGLREKRAVTGAIDPDLRRTDGLAKNFQIAHRLSRTEKWQDLGATGFGDAVGHERAGLIDIDLGMLKIPRDQRIDGSGAAAIDAMARAHAALIEQHDVVMFEDALVEGPQRPVGNADAGLARPAHGIDENAAIVAGRQMNRIFDIEGAIVGRIVVIEGRRHGDADEIADITGMRIEPVDNVGKAGRGRRARGEAESRECHRRGDDHPKHVAVAVIHRPPIHG